MFIVINQERGKREGERGEEKKEGCKERERERGIFLKISMKCLDGYKHT